MNAGTATGCSCTYAAWYLWWCSNSETNDMVTTANLEVHMCTVTILAHAWNWTLILVITVPKLTMEMPYPVTSACRNTYNLLGKSVLLLLNFN
jgi:hypothetical protein